MNPLKKKNRRGLAYLTAIVFMYASLGMILILNRKIGMIKNIITHESFMQRTQDKKYIALSYGLNILQTGNPPKSPSKYCVTLIEFPSEPKYSITYNKLPGNIWRLTISSSGVGSCQPLPEEF